jgi:hypothetical protein
MSKDINMHLLLNKKEEARKIVLEIMNYGVNESQKIDIMYLMAMNLDDNKKMKEITNFLKKYKESINDEEKHDNNHASDTKIILT